MSLWQGLNVPSQNSTRNIYINDVIGNKTDDEYGNSIYSKNYLIEKHLHNKVFCYPERINCITLTKAAGVWADYPTPIEIIPTDIINDPFDLHFMNISTIDANGQYTIQIYSGTTGNEIIEGTYAAAKTAVQSQEGSRVIITRVFPPGTRISAAISSENSLQNSLCLKLEGHTY